MEEHVRRDADEDDEEQHEDVRAAEFHRERRSFMGDVVAAFVRQSAMKIDAQRDQKAADEILIPIRAQGRFRRSNAARKIRRQGRRSVR